jgi:hypothetical protein
MIGPRDRAIAQLAAQGLQQDEIAQLSGVSTRTVQRVVAEPAVAAEITRLQEQGIEFDPARVALRNALLANRANGQPDHQVRVQAARALLASAPPVDPDQPHDSGGIVHLHGYLLHADDGSVLASTGLTPEMTPDEADAWATQARASALAPDAPPTD